MAEKVDSELLKEIVREEMDALKTMVAEADDRITTSNFKIQEAAEQLDSSTARLENLISV